MSHCTPFWTSNKLVYTNELYKTRCCSSWSVQKNLLYDTLLSSFYDKTWTFDEKPMKKKSSYLCKSVCLRVCFQFQSDRAGVGIHSSVAEGSGPIRLRTTSRKQTACHLDMLFTRLLLFFNATLERDEKEKSGVFWKMFFTPKKRQNSPPVRHQTKLLLK